ncbi:MAG: hypothetical protein KJ718_06480 [Nanoarchaeota archaeon]|nr:hypothetical protein [Nanoarchaeota archaeon]MBU1052164.1 hypothetical protein [Nanoarchaeota archaeon]MBU1987980.1 hypothetical protein [Nanoarchaeota archaeon]
MRKKAIVRENLLSIIIAVIGLILLFYGAWYLISISTDNQEQKAAQTIIEKVEAKINLLEAGQSTELSTQGINENWFIKGWDENEDSPDKCLFKTCLCICKGDEPIQNREIELQSNLPDQNTNRILEEIKNNCQDNGFCRKFESEKISTHWGNTAGSVGYFYDSIPVPDKLLKIKISLDENSRLTLYYED